MTLITHELEFRVQYNETDGQGRVHHGQYLNYFERGRVELMRAEGFSYKEFESSGLFLVVSEMHLRYLGAAEFDDLLKLTTTVTKMSGVRIYHTYRITKAEDTQQSILEGSSVVACITHEGKVAPLPSYFRQMAPKK